MTPCLPLVIEFSQVLKTQVFDAQLDSDQACYSYYLVSKYCPYHWSKKIIYLFYPRVRAKHGQSEQQWTDFIKSLEVLITKFVKSLLQVIQVQNYSDGKTRRGSTISGKWRHN